MSVTYGSIGWNSQKKKYDLVMLGGRDRLSGGVHAVQPLAESEYHG
jgi:hypothetical protein